MRHATLVASSLVVFACGAEKPPQTPARSAPGPTAQIERTSSANASNVDTGPVELSLLVGPEGEAVTFRDQRRLHLGRGSVRVAVRGVPSDIESSNVSVRTLTSGAQLELVEFRAYMGSLTPRGLLAPYIGKQVAAYVWDNALQREESKVATLLGLSPDGPIVAIGGETRVLSFGRVAVAKLPDNVRVEPTLELLMTSDRDAQDVELTYGSKLVKGGMMYQVVREPGAATAQLVGLVGISNESDTGIPAAKLSFTSEATTPPQFASPGKEMTSLTNFVRMPTAVSIGPGERSTIRLFGPSAAGLTRRVVLEGPGLPIDGDPEEYGNTSVRAVLDAAVANGAVLSPNGMIPGLAHLFERAAGESPRAYGTAGARPLPGARGLRVDLGSEDKYPTKRRMTGKKSLGRCIFETTWDISVSNPTEEALPFEDVEPVSGKYEVIESSITPSAKESDHFAFAFTVPAQGEARVKFRVRTSSCVTVRRRYWVPWVPSWGKAGSGSFGGSKSS